MWHPIELKQLSGKTISNEILCLAMSKMECDDHLSFSKATKSPASSLIFIPVVSKIFLLRGT